jgi:hypothetical protein
MKRNPYVYKGSDKRVKMEHSINASQHASMYNPCKVEVLVKPSLYARWETLMNQTNSISTIIDKDQHILVKTFPDYYWGLQITNNNDYSERFEIMVDGKPASLKKQDSTKPNGHYISNYFFGHVINENRWT